MKGIKDPFFISTSARSGSLFFCGLLSSTGKVQEVHEHFRDGRGILSDEDLKSYWMNMGIDLKSTWGTKIDVRDLPMTERFLSIRGISDYRSLKWIWLRRRDKINQAISHCKILETGIQRLYLSDSEEKKKLARTDMELSVELMNQFALLYFFVDQVWERFFDEHKIEPYRLFYEDFVDESTWLPTITGVLDFLEISYELPMSVGPSQIKQSANHISVNYDRFLDYNHEIYKGHGYERHFWRDEN